MLSTGLFEKQTLFLIEFKNIAVWVYVESIEDVQIFCTIDSFDLILMDIVEFIPICKN